MYNITNYNLLSFNYHNYMSSEHSGYIELKVNMYFSQTASVFLEQLQTINLTKEVFDIVCY